jgi:hypothetical protein
VSAECSDVSRYMRAVYGGISLVAIDADMAHVLKREKPYREHFLTFPTIANHTHSSSEQHDRACLAWLHDDSG